MQEYMRDRQSETKKQTSETEEPAYGVCLRAEGEEVACSHGQGHTLVELGHHLSRTRVCSS